MPEKYRVVPFGGQGFQRRKKYLIRRVKKC